MQGEANRSLLPRALPSKETSRSMSSSPMLRGIAKRWRELHSKDSWKGLLDPLDIDLRKSIISYGELAQAAYDAFNREKRSPHAGACLYGRSDLLAGSGVAAAGNYAVTKFIYATSALPVPDAFLFLPLPALKDAWCRESNWIGYVAVATDEGAAALGRRDVVVAWRGTIKNLEWVNDLDFTKVSAAPVLGAAAAANPDAKVHRGFLSVYTSSNANSKFSKTSARDQVLEEVRRLMALYKDEATSITTTGHSLGASLATLNAADIAANGLNAAAGGSSQPPCPVTAIVFASPRVGNHSFKLALGSFRDLKLLHVKNANDLVHTYPHIGYEDVAVPLPITTGRSPYLRHPGTLQALHNLECYLPSRAFPPTPFLSRRRVEDAPPHIPTPAPLRTGRAGTYSSRPPAPRVLPPELNLLLPTRICCAGRGPPAGREGGGKPAVFARGPRDGDAEVEGGSGGAREQLQQPS